MNDTNLDTWVPSVNSLRDSFDSLNPEHLRNLLAQLVAQFRGSPESDALRGAIGAILAEYHTKPGFEGPEWNQKFGMLLLADSSLAFELAEIRRTSRLTLSDRILKSLAVKSMTSTDLAQQLDVDISQVSRAVRRLDDLGAIAREINPGDGRSQLLSQKHVPAEPSM